MATYVGGYETARVLVLKLRNMYGFKKGENFCGIHYVSEFQKEPYESMRFFIECLGQDKSRELFEFENNYSCLKGKSIYNIAKNNVDDYLDMENDFLAMIES